MADTIKDGQAVIVTSPPPEKSTQSVRFRPMNLGDILRVHEIDQLSFSLPWPENSYRFRADSEPFHLGVGD